MKSISTIIGVAAVTLLTCGVFVWLNADEQLDQMPFAAASMENQLYADGKTLEVTYDYTQTGVGSSEKKYSRTPKRVMYLSCETQDYVWNDSYDTATDECRSYELSKIRGDQYGTLAMGSAGTNPLRRTDVMDPILYPVVDGFLLDSIRKGVMAQAMEDIDGHLCYRVDVTPEGESLKQYSVWMDPNVGYCPRKMVVHESKPTTVEFSDYVDLGGGIWFPKKITQTVDMPLLRKKFPKTIPSDTVELVSTATNVRLIETSAQPPIVQFPTGTKVRDEIAGRTYTVP